MTRGSEYKLSVRRRSLVQGAATLVLASLLPPAPRASAQSQASDPDAYRAEPPQAPAKQEVAELPGAKLFYWDTGGTGEAVVLSHPGTGSALIWGYQQPVFAAAGYRVIGYSRRGYYGSDAAPGGSEIEDLHNLSRFLGIDRFHAVGSAGGGITVTRYALDHPENLLSLTIACSIVGVRDPGYQALDGILRPAPFAQMPADFRELGPSYRAFKREGVKRWLELEAMSRQGSGPLPPPPPPPASGAPDPAAITWEKLSALRVPVLLLGGDADSYTPPSVLRQFAKRIPGSEMHVIAEAGHSAYWEQPDIFNRLVLDFLKRHPRR